MTEQEPKTTTLWTGVVIEMSPGDFEKLPLGERVARHAEALARFWNEDWKKLLEGIQQNTGLTQLEAMQFHGLVLLNSCAKHLTQIADATHYCASVLYTVTKTPPKEPWQEP